MRQKRYIPVGIGLKWIIWTAVLSSPIAFIAWRFSDYLTIRNVWAGVFYIPAAVLGVCGLILWYKSITALKRCLKQGKICTSGAYGWCRHPLYAAWTFFLIPAGLLLFRSPILLLCSAIMYIVLRRLIPLEEQALQEQFGQKYLEYKNRVKNMLFPFPCRADNHPSQENTHQCL